MKQKCQLRVYRTRVNIYKKTKALLLCMVTFRETVQLTYTEIQKELNNYFPLYMEDKQGIV